MVERIDLTVEEWLCGDIKTELSLNEQSSYKTYQTTKKVRERDAKEFRLV